MYFITHPIQKIRIIKIVNNENQKELHIKVKDYVTFLELTKWWVNNEKEYQNISMLMEKLKQLYINEKEIINYFD
jgi:hypothetical protein